jgi:hypothetical protein
MRVGVLYLGRDPREGGTTWSGSSLRALPTPDLASFLEGGEHRALISSLHRGEGIPLSLGGLRILLWAGEGGRAVEKVRQVNVGPAGEPRQAVSLSRSSFRRVGRPDHMDELRFTAEAMTRKKGPLLSVDRPLEVSIELEDRSLSLPLEVKSSLEEPVSATSEDGELVVHAQLGLDAERLRLYEVEAKPGQIEQSLRQAFGAGSRIVGGDGEVIWVIATGE